MRVTLLGYYQKILERALEKLTASNPRLSRQEVLEILLTRDALSKALSKKIKPSVSAISKIQELDRQLKENSEILIEFINLEEYRDNFPKNPDAWWWYLDVYAQEKARKYHPWNRFDWLFRVFRVILWTGNIALLGTLASLFLSGSSGLVGAVTIAIPSILSLLQAQSELTETGKKGFDNFLERLNIPQHFHEEAKLASSFLMTGLLLGIWFALPSISNAYTRAGKRLEELDKLASAEENYLKAVQLDPDNFKAHYNLGNLYRLLQDFESAKKQYLIAAKGGNISAYNNLAYLYLQKGHNEEERENRANEEAIKLLLQGRKHLAERDKNWEQLTDEEKLDLEVQRYYLFKNLGWARFKQERYEDAMDYLIPAIDIAKNPKYRKKIENPGAAFCIYAQVLQNTAPESSQVKLNWKQCRKLIKFRLEAGVTINSEEDGWLYEAKQKLK